MKTVLFIAAFLSLCFPVIAQTSVHRAKILDIEGKVQQTPVFQISGVEGKDTDPRYWIEIEAEVEVETKSPSGFIPELEARWFAVVMNKHSDQAVPVRLLGSTTYKNISTSDGKIFLCAYIEPDTIERITGEKRPNERDIEGYALVLSGPGIYTKGKHGKGLSKATAEEKAEWWKVWKHESLDGLIIPKSQTPFASLWTDRYPTEKLTKR